MIVLINKLKKKLNLEQDIIDCILKYDRQKFYPINDITIYYNRPKIIKGTNQTMSAPHIHAITLQKFNIILQKELLKVKNKYHKLKFNVLDVGCGTGYTTATISEMLKIKENKCKIIGVDINDYLINLTLNNLKKTGFKNEIKNGKIVIRNKDGWEGHSVYAPYKFINVAANALSIPNILYHQLDINGIMLIPINGEYMLIKKIVKNGNITMTKTKLMNVRFVKLIKFNKNII